MKNTCEACDSGVLDASSSENNTVEMQLTKPALVRQYTLQTRLKSTVALRPGRLLKTWRDTTMWPKSYMHAIKL